ncbi:hypothetical protein FACS1894179_03450 [Bacteroidia bacterium]|nr:hypothetical protein FACS1894179_03450 [Bacteroidia bacterium]
MNAMDKYAGIILRILGDNRIEGVYDPVNGLVYIFHEDDAYGCVCNLFSLYGPHLESRLVCAMRPAHEDARLVRACLSGINRLLGWDGFYLDPVTGCIACSVDYTVPVTGLRYGDADLERFCTQAWKTYFNNRNTLSRMIRRMYDTGEAE